MGDDLISGLLIALLILAVAFLILRELFCWYWKINKLVELQEKQNNLLEKLTGQLKNTAPITSEVQQAQSSKTSHMTEENQSDGEDDISKDNLFK